MSAPSFCLLRSQHARPFAVPASRRRLSLIFPNNEIKTDELRRAAGHPADRIPESHHIGVVGDAAPDEEVDLPDHDKAGQHADHRDLRLAAAAQGTRENVVDRVEDQEKCVHPDEVP